MLELEIVKGLKDSEIRQIMLDRGYTIKEGQDDLKPYVYEAAYDIEAVTMKKWREIARRQNRLIDSLTTTDDTNALRLSDGLGVMPSTQEMEEIGLGMTNFDGSIDDGFAEALQASPGKVMGRHSGWNFKGLVYFYGGKFHEEVWVYGSPRQTMSAGSLRKLMDAVCEQYGHD